MNQLQPNQTAEQKPSKITKNIEKQVEAQRCKVLIIGAGPAGLAAAGALTQAKIPYVMLEKSNEIGRAWRNHYDRLHLHTVKFTSWLPHLKFPKSYPRYPSRQQVVDYLEAYAQHFGIRPLFGREVRRAYYQDGAWHVETTQGNFIAGNLIVASGYNADPVIPRFQGFENFQGEVLHSSKYKTGASFKGKDVLIVGCGNSGAEIAIDLHENGARPTMVVRSPIHVVPRDMNGIPVNLTTIALAKLPLSWSDKISGLILRLHNGDLTPYGLRPPKEGPIRQVIEKGRVPLLDIGTLDMIKSGELRIVPGIESFDENGAIFKDGRRFGFDAVILATGYKARLDVFLMDADRLTDRRGYPIAHGRDSEVPGLFFTGFKNPPEGALREMRIEAKGIAKALSKRIRRQLPG